MKSISWIVLMGFMWSNIVTYYPQIEEILPALKELHHVNDFGSALEEEEFEETSCKHLPENNQRMELTKFDSTPGGNHDFNSVFTHNAEVITPPPQELIA